MNKTELKEIRNDLINQFNNGISIDDLCLKYNSSRTNMYAIISPIFRHSVVDVSKEEEKQIIDLYTNKGYSTTRIGEQLRIYHKIVARILDEYGIERNGVGNRKWYIDEHYFDKIDTPNKAYILGLLYADGYNSETKAIIRLMLQEDDFEILEKIRKELQYSKPLVFVKCDDKVSKLGYTSKNMYSLHFYNKHMSDKLKEYGMMQNKSLILKFPSKLKDELIPHFVRGYMDGDGCIYKSTKSNAISLTSTNEFCTYLQGYLRAKFDIYCGIYDASNHNGITKVLMISDKNNTKKFLDWIYEDAELYMQRKHEIYINKYVA